MVLAVTPGLAADFLRTGSDVATQKATLTVVKSYGTAFLVAPGRLITNAHVVANHDGFAILNPVSGAQTPAHVLAVDANRDLALLAADVPGTPLKLAPPAEKMEPLERVYAIGFPDPEQYGFDRKLAAGWVNEVASENDPREASMTLAVRAGNSGSPVFSPDWEVLGVVNGGFVSPLLRDGVQSTSDPLASVIRLPDLRAFLQTNGVTPSTGATSGALSDVAPQLASAVFPVETF